MSEWFQPSAPAGIQTRPWLHPDAIAYMNTILRPEFDVMEFGAGGSTLWFAKRVHGVVSFETNVKWMEAVLRFRQPNVLLVHTGHYKGVVSERFEHVDLLFIDGEPVAERASWLMAAPHIVKDGGWIVLDNANRPEYAAEREELNKCAELVHRVDGNQHDKGVHTDYLVTEFWRLRESRN